MSRSNPLYDGKAKTLYEGPEPGTIIQYFKDDMTAGNGKKHEIIPGKGVLNNRISEYVMTQLEEIGIHTHFIKAMNMREQLVKACEIIPIEVIVRNVTAGSLAKRFGVEEGMLLPRPLIEWNLKSDKLGDPMITDDHIISFDWALEEELDEMRNVSLRVNDFLLGLFMGAGIKLIDMKLEFGRIYDEEGNLYIVLADEITPDNCRLWDVESGDRLDKDRFRMELGDVEKGYREVAKRLGIFSDSLKHEEEEAAKEAAKEKTPAKKVATKKKKPGPVPANKNTKK